MKTLVIILAETRAWELTYDNMKKNLIDQLNADLCLCIGVGYDYDYSNSFYKLAKYHFLYNETDDYEEAYKHMAEIVKYNKLEKLENINLEFEESEYVSDSNIITDFDKEYIYKEGKLYSISNPKFFSFFHQNDVITYKKPIYWKEFFKLQDQFMGGIKESGHPGAGGILFFYRWFLLQKLIEHNLIEKYDRFVITRSDFIFTMPHPKLELLDPRFIWLPNDQHYEGYTDRLAVLSKSNVVQYLDFLNCMIKKSNEYFTGMKMQGKNNWNIERVLKFHLSMHKCSVKEFPYIMYTVRAENGSTRWSIGTYVEEYGYYIKYWDEYAKADFYKKKLNKEFKGNIDEFYSSLIN